MSTQPTKNFEQVGQNVTLEWLDEGRIAIFSVRNATRKDVEIWANRAEELIRAWDLQQTYAVAHDVQLAFLSAYAQERAKGISALVKSRGLQGRYAVVVANNVFGQAIRLFVNITLRAKDDLTGQCFTSREVALAWLREQFV